MTATRKIHLALATLVMATIFGGLLYASPAQAQSLGLRAGAHVAGSVTEGAAEAETSVGSAWGVSYRHPLTNAVSLRGSALLRESLALGISVSTDDVTADAGVYSSMELSGLARVGPEWVYLLAGPFMSFKTGGTGGGTDFGFSAGLGLEAPMSRFGIALEGLWSFGLKNMSTAGSSKSRGVSILFGLTYEL